MKKLSKRNDLVQNTLSAFSLRSCWCYCNACTCKCDCNSTNPSSSSQSKGQTLGRSQGETNTQSGSSIA